MQECRVCYGQVALDALGAHMMWHNQQREMIELTVKNFEGLVDIVNRMIKAQLPRGPRQ